MIRIHKDGRFYWAEVIDLHRDRLVGCTFRNKERAAVLQEALRIEREYTCDTNPSENPMERTPSDSPEQDATGKSS